MSDPKKPIDMGPGRSNTPWMMRLTDVIAKVEHEIVERKKKGNHWGHQDLERAVYYWACGLRMQVPLEWASIVPELVDPEYSTYLRLKEQQPAFERLREKFEGKK